MDMAETSVGLLTVSADIVALAGLRMLRLRWRATFGAGCSEHRAWDLDRSAQWSLV